MCHTLIPETYDQTKPKYTVKLTIDNMHQISSFKFVEQQYIISENSFDTECYTKTTTANGEGERQKKTIQTKLQQQL